MLLGARPNAVYIMRNTMPAASPRVSDAKQAELAALGARLRARRRELGVTAVDTAEAAGMSRVTLHRIENGNPAVTIGAYLNVAAALGLQLRVVEPVEQPACDVAGGRTGTVRVGDYPQLRQIGWQLRDDTELTEEEALHLYERNWRHVDRDAMDEREREFVQHLADVYSHGRLLV